MGFTSLTPLDLQDAMVTSLCNRMTDVMQLNINLPESRAMELEHHIQRVCRMHSTIDAQIADLQQQSICSMIEIWHDTSDMPFHTFREDATFFLMLEPKRFVVWRFLEALNATTIYELVYDDATNRWWVIGSHETAHDIIIENEPWTQPGSRCFWNVTRTPCPTLLNLPHLEGWLHRLADFVADHPDRFHNVYTF